MMQSSVQKSDSIIIILVLTITNSHEFIISQYFNKLFLNPDLFFALL